MSQQKILNTLQNLGFSSLDAQVYLFLGKKGPKKVSELVQALKIPKQQLYTILKNLQSRGIINSTLEHPAKFSTEPFEKVLDLFVKSRMEEAQLIQSNKNEILTDWQLIKIEEDKDKSSTFKVLEGNNYIYPKLRQIIEEAQTQLSIVFSIPELMRINQNEVLDELLNRITNASIKLRILTDISSQNLEILNNLLNKKFTNLEMRAPDFGLKLPNSMVIRDQNEIAFMIDSIEKGTDRSTCLWTNCGALVQSFNFVFNDSWQNATDIRKKIAEIKTGKPSPKTIVIKDADIAQKKYDEITGFAKKSILVLTSSTELPDYLKKVENWVDKGISVRIMAPILNENLDHARQLMKICQVKHIPVGYIGTIIIDSEYLFQIKTPLIQKEGRHSKPYLAIYTNDDEFVKKTEHMLNDIWNKSQTPSPVEIKAIIEQPSSLIKPTGDNILDQHKRDLRKIVGFSYKMEPNQSAITEKEVLEKIEKAIRVPVKDPKKDIVQLYGTQANAAIYPQKKLNLPNFLVIIYHNNKKTSFGAENSMQIHCQMKVTNRESYFPVAFITDNPRGYKFRKAMQKIQPTHEVAYLLSKDELDIQIHGEKLVAGWTVPIPLLPPKYILPPACIIFEGYGKIKTYRSEMVGPFSQRLVHEYNMLDAFVTFIHSSAKYNGPGSDGILLRESILTAFPLDQKL